MTTSSSIKIVGISGTNGSGKDTVGQMLAERYNFLFISGSDLLREEAKKRGLPIERHVLSSISAEWRRNEGMGAVSARAFKYYETQKDKYSGFATVSLRHPGEADFIHGKGGIVVWVDADPKIRYERIYSRQRTTEDNKTYEEFLAEQEREMSHSGDHATLNMSAVKERADIRLTNDGNDIEAFKNEAAKALGLKA
jgi:dephospho-CoA kinase